jgi:hypothetical protein
MTEEEKLKLRALLAYILRMLKSNDEATSKLSSELASVTSAVRGLDPTFDEVLESRREGVAEISDQITRDALDLYDEMIRRVERGDFL